MSPVPSLKMNRRLAALAKRFQLDRSLLWVLAARIWQVVSGPLTICLIGIYLSLDEQGVYYGIFSFLTIQAFFELGLLSVLITFAGHEAASLNVHSPPALEDEAWQRAAMRMAELLRASRRWFAAAGVVYGGVALLMGWNVLSDLEFTNPVAWHWPLVLVLPCAALTVVWSPDVAILEGIGLRETVYRIRLLQAFSGSLVVWGCLTMGLGIWSVVAATATQTLWTGYLVAVHGRPVFKPILAQVGQSAEFSWRKDVVPFQWKVAVNGVLYYVTTQCFVLIILWFSKDSAEAGRLGMTLTATAAIQMLAMAWVQAKYPVAASLHGAGEREQAGTMWRQIAISSSALLVLAFVALTLLVMLLPWLDSRFENRFVSPEIVAMLGLGCLANHLSAIQSFYILSRRFPPLMIMIPAMIISASSIWLAGYFYSTWGIACAYAASFWLVLLPLQTWGYLKLRKR
ncbi:hypothetical protein Poly24_10690 [Rosistilla carotiformis]|uniref:Polysaccharide biosynthesis protein n=1 Tax=Rosistilla carotiformis TaxID=2528017 RepID=A0A518JPA7_9BACT|nr:hypothetical protein [Rosistilla carotiformis]QDV67374.1 hypothetical protein Poly24_10690 [Rosistilla carotiformis]